MQYLLAHDLGTSGDKATLFTTDGALAASTVVSYPCRYEAGGRAEQDPADWYAAVCRATRTLLEQVEARDVAGVSFSGHMMGAVLLDRALQVTDVDAQTFASAGAPAWAAQSAANLSTCGMLDGAENLGAELARGQAAQLLCAALELLDSRDTGWF